MEHISPLNTQARARACGGASAAKHTHPSTAHVGPQGRPESPSPAWGSRGTATRPPSNGATGRGLAPQCHRFGDEGLEAFPTASASTQIAEEALAGGLTDPPLNVGRSHRGAQRQGRSSRHTKVVDHHNAHDGPRPCRAGDGQRTGDRQRAEHDFSTAVAMAGAPEAKPRGTLQRGATGRGPGARPLGSRQGRSAASARLLPWPRRQRPSREERCSEAPQGEGLACVHLAVAKGGAPPQHGCCHGRGARGQAARSVAARRHRERVSCSTPHRYPLPDLAASD